MESEYTIHTSSGWRGRVKKGQEVKIEPQSLLEHSRVPVILAHLRTEGESIKILIFMSPNGSNHFTNIYLKKKIEDFNYIVDLINQSPDQNVRLAPSLILVSKTSSACYWAEEFLPYTRHFETIEIAPLQRKLIQHHQKRISKPWGSCVIRGDQITYYLQDATLRNIKSK